MAQVLALPGALPPGVASELGCVRSVVYNPYWSNDQVASSAFVKTLGVANAKLAVTVLYYFVYVPFFPMLLNCSLEEEDLGWRA